MKTYQRARSRLIRRSLSESNYDLKILIDELVRHGDNESADVLRDARSLVERARLELDRLLPVEVVSEGLK